MVPILQRSTCYETDWKKIKAFDSLTHQPPRMEMARRIESFPLHSMSESDPRNFEGDRSGSVHVCWEMYGNVS